MVIEATDKETGAKWAIKKVNKEKVRLLCVALPGCGIDWVQCQGGVGWAVHLPLFTQFVSSLEGQDWTNCWRSVGTTLISWEGTSSCTQADSSCLQNAKASAEPV